MILIAQARKELRMEELFLNRNCRSPKNEDNLKFRNNASQLIVNCTNNHPITSLFRGQLYEINEQKRDISIFSKIEIFIPNER